MKRYRLFLPIFLCLCFACTQFDEEAMLDEAPTTRAAVNAAALRESAGIANADNPYSVDNMKAAMTQYCKVMNIQPQPVYATHEYVRFEVRDSLDYYILEDSLELEMFTYPLDRMLNNAERSFYAADIVNGKSGYIRSFRRISVIRQRCPNRSFRRFICREKPCSRERVQHPVLRPG